MDAELIKHIELLVGSIGVILGVFFSVFLLLSRKNQPKASFFLAIYLVTFSLRIGKSLFHNYFEINSVLRTMFLTLLLCVGPALWLYTRSMISPKRSINYKDYTHFLPFLVLLGFSWTIPNDGISWIFAVFYDFLIFHMFCYILFSLFWLDKNKEKEEIYESKKVIKWLFSFLVINLVVVTLYLLISKLIIPFYIGFSFLFSTLIIYFSFWALRNPFLFRVPKEKYLHSTIDSLDANQLMIRLKKLMEDEKPYLDPSLTLLELSQKLDASAKELSQTINQIESINYSKFIAKYRVEEVQRLLQLPSHANFTIAAIAYDSGFSSISSFNTIFKNHTGMTASDYRNSLKTK